MKRGDIITAEMLLARHACEDEVAIVRREWPDGVKLTLGNLRKAASLKLDLYWFAESFLSPPAREVFDEATAAAWKVYCEATAPAQKVYDEATAPAGKVFDEAIAPARKVYDEAIAPAWKVYVEARAAAGKIYDEAAAKALWAALEKEEKR